LHGTHRETLITHRMSLLYTKCETLLWQQWITNFRHDHRFRSQRFSERMHL
jgi:hypothetical protein